MATKRNLRAVRDDQATSPAKQVEQPKQSKRPTLVEAVETGDYKQILIAQRREIAQSVGRENGPAKAALHRQLLLIAKEIAEIESREEREPESGGSVVEDEAFDTSAV